MRTEEKKGKNYVITGEFLRQTKKKQMAAALGIAVILGITGCAGKEGARENPQENVSAGAENDTERQENTDGGTENGQEVESG